MGDSVSYDANNRVASTHVAATKSAEDIEAAAATSRLTDTSRLGKLAPGGKGMPKPGPGEDMLTPAYRARLSAWRSSQRGEAVTEMMKPAPKK